MKAIKYFNKFNNGNKIIIFILFISFITIFKKFNFELQSISLFDNIIPVYSNYVLTKTECGGLGNQVSFLNLLLKIRRENFSYFDLQLFMELVEI